MFLYIADSNNIIGHGRKLKLVKVDRWDNGLYYCSANVNRTDTNQKTAFHLEVAAPKVSSNSPLIKELGIDLNSLKKIQNSLSSFPTTHSVSNNKRRDIVSMADEFEEKSALQQHAAFGEAGHGISLNCTVIKFDKF